LVARDAPALQTVPTSFRSETEIEIVHSQAMYPFARFPNGVSLAGIKHAPNQLPVGESPFFNVLAQPKYSGEAASKIPAPPDALLR
jgi:hypothetical protein